MIYLASPYRHDNPAIMAQRLDATRDATERMIRGGLRVFSPLVYSTAMQADPPDTWYEFDLDILGRCDELVVLMLPGWQDSYGVGLEIERACNLWGLKGISQLYPNMVSSFMKQRRKGA